jgi:hypothetical protein
MAQRCSYCGKTKPQHHGKACIDIPAFKILLGDSPLTPHGEKLARVKEMCTEGYTGLSPRDKDDIREVLHSLLDVTREAACPCCKAGTNIEKEPCQECKGTGFAIVAYETLRVHLKLALEQITAELENPRMQFTVYQAGLQFAKDAITNPTKIESCPHCGVPLTGMNSNAEECLHNPRREKRTEQ